MSHYSSAMSFRLSNVTGVLNVLYIPVLRVNEDSGKQTKVKQIRKEAETNRPLPSRLAEVSVSAMYFLSWD
jgi:hypothetical protein